MIREENLTILTLISFVIQRELNMSTHILELLSRMKLLKGKIVIQEMARVMLHTDDTSMQFWAKAIRYCMLHCQ